MGHGCVSQFFRVLKPKTVSRLKHRKINVGLNQIVWILLDVFFEPTLPQACLLGFFLMFVEICQAMVVWQERRVLGLQCHFARSHTDSKIAWEWSGGNV